MPWENLQDEVAEEFQSIAEQTLYSNDIIKLDIFTKCLFRELQRRQEKSFERLTLGCCARCDNKRVSFSKRFCLEHFVQNKNRNKEYYNVNNYKTIVKNKRDTRVAHGLCARCSDQLDAHSKRHCTRHHVENRELARKRRAKTKMIRVASFIKHIAKGKKAVCGEVLLPGDKLVIAALSSNCDACRAKVGIAGVNEKTWDGKQIGVSKEVVWEPETMVGTTLAEIRKRRDGR